jgi:hypothetical protein
VHVQHPTLRLHSEVRSNALYVMVIPPDLVEPVPLALAGLRPDYRARLRQLVRGDEIPPEIVARLLDGAPRFVWQDLAPPPASRGSASGTATG